MLPNVLKRKQSTYPSVWDEFFSNDFFPSFFNYSWPEDKSFAPAVNVEETDKSYVLEVAAPGLDKKDFKVDVDNNVLTISSRKENKREEKKNGYLRREFNYGSFSRSFSLPEDVEVDKIKANHKNGVLKVEVPKDTITTVTKEINIL